MCSDNEVQRHVVRSIAAFLESVPRELCYHHLVKVSHLVLSFRFWKSNQVQLFIPFSFYSCLESYFQFFFLSGTALSYNSEGFGLELDVSK